MLPEPLTNDILTWLDALKAVDVLTVDLAGKTDIADAMIVATGTSKRHVLSLAEKVAEEMKHHYGRIIVPEGMAEGEWVLLDIGDVIVHLFQAPIRDRYRLEEMWNMTMRPSLS